MNGRGVKFILPYPKLSHFRYQAAHDQAVRQRWRALFLVIKAKLEAVESEIVLFEDEFLPHFILPGGMTVAEKIRNDPQFSALLLEGGNQALITAGPQ